MPAYTKIPTHRWNSGGVMSVHERAAFGGQLWFAGIQGGGLSASWICGCVARSVSASWSKTLKRRARSFVHLQMRCTISSVKNSLKHSIGDLMFSKLILLAVPEDEASPSPRAAASAAWRRRAASAGESSSGVASAGVASVASSRSGASLGGMIEPIGGCLNHLCPPASEGRWMVAGLVPVDPHGGSRPGAGAGPPKTPSGTYRHRGAGHSEVPVLAAAAARVLV